MNACINIAALTSELFSNWKAPLLLLAGLMAMGADTEMTTSVVTWGSLAAVRYQSLVSQSAATRVPRTSSPPDVAEVHAHDVPGVVTLPELGDALVAHDDAGGAHLGHGGRVAGVHRGLLQQHARVLGRAAVGARDVVEEVARAAGVRQLLLQLQQLDDHAGVRGRVREHLLVVGHLPELAGGFCELQRPPESGKSGRQTLHDAHLTSAKPSGMTQLNAPPNSGRTELMIA